jgi:thiamine kinase-like enzyme
VNVSLEELLSHVPCFRGRPLTISPLTGGITNRNWRVAADGETFVLRVAGEKTALLGIDRQCEHAAAQAAAALDVGAEVVAYLPQQQALVTRFLEGRVLSADDAIDPAVMARIVRSLRRYHESQPGLGRFCGFTTIRDYHRRAGEHGVSLPETIARAIAQLDEIERSLPAGGPLCPCHNDLLPANLIDDGATVRIIDWEYAGMGDRWFDLGNFAENHRFNRRQEARLLSEYFGELQAADLRRLHQMRRVSALREATWGFLQAGISSLDFDFLGYANDHLERFFADPSVRPS